MFLEVDGWKTDIRFSAAHFIPSHDKCSRLHGHDYFVRARVFGEPENEFIIDYLELIQLLKIIVKPMDHRIIVPDSSGTANVSVKDGVCTVKYLEKEIRVSDSDTFHLPAPSSSSEELSKYIATELQKRVAENQSIEKIQVCVDEGPGMGACHEIRNRQ
ncbi:MAG: 6-carboxytetrahydropterin synthase [Candidatus Thermoplasmatota archaeon]|nr:6-carboxytetrahydropterin synthase [Candidatus Thermoplasmatota archaeon]MCL5731398.1 6-carboxytetrahydropterin synthase [Candidatus Thermoplasmatota archaeon]